MHDERERERRRMIQESLLARDIVDVRVLQAFDRVPREAFVPPDALALAYEDEPLAIGHGQTISQPYVVAWMTQALELTGRERVLEVGTGSGYAAAILASLAKEVITLERIPDLAERARARLAELGYDNVVVEEADGTLGLAARAPFDAIVVAAGAPEVPARLREQLVVGGRLVIPIGHDRDVQTLVRVVRTTSGWFEEMLGEVRFVPLIGTEGWADTRESDRS
jgi:protein-L-isoaspartate(D-aspartate) O-methyltransferase